jgi:nucleoside-diphosphate-sugar epimerase/aminoglycoside phosphotransferase (APT) family kinase protein
VRILAIGGNGFIGRFASALLLAAGHEVVVFHRGRTPLEVAGAGEIIGSHQELPRFAGEIARLGPDVVIDFILGSARHAEALLAALDGRAGRLVVLSSQDVYRATGVLHRLEPGDPDPVPLAEDAPLRTRLRTYPPAAIEALRGVFGWVDDEYDKIPVERAVVGQTAIPSVVLRLPMVFGPGDPLHRLFPILKRVDDGRRQILLDERMAPWRSTRGYVENVAAAIALAATAPAATGIYNVGETIASEREWTGWVAAAAGFAGEVAVVPAAVAPPHLHPPGNTAQDWVADSSRFQRELGFAPPVPLDVALARTIAWERTHPPAHIDPAQLDYAAEDRASVARYLPEELTGEIEAVCFLSSGLSGAGVYGVTTARGELVLRVQPEHGHGDWAQQLLVMQRAAERGVAPAILHVDREARAVVSARVAGAPLGAALGDPAQRGPAIASVVAQLRALHAIDPAGVGERDPIAWARTLHQAERGRPGFPAWARGLDPVIAAAAATLARDRRRVVSHNDLNPGNVMWDGARAWLVDWEVAGLAHPYYDLAAMAMFLRLDDAAALGLLAQQEGRAIDAGERADFAGLRRLAAVLCGLTLMGLVPDLAALPEPAPTLVEFYGELRAGRVDLDAPGGRGAFALALLRLVSDEDAG